MFELRFAAVAFETAVADLNHRKSGMDRSDIPSSPPPIVSEMSESDGLACDIENRPSLFVARLEARRQVLQVRGPPNIRYLEHKVAVKEFIAAM